MSRFILHSILTSDQKEVSFFREQQCSEEHLWLPNHTTLQLGCLVKVRAGVFGLILAATYYYFMRTFSSNFYEGQYSEKEL